MDLYFDLSKRRFVTSNGTNDTVGTLEFKRGDKEPLVVRFCRGITIVELDGGYSGVLGLKEQGDFDGDYVAYAGSWTKEGTGAATTYTFELDLDTAELDELLGVGVATDEASVVVNFEMEITDGDVVTSSNTIAATVFNDVVRTGSSTPVSLASQVIHVSDSITGLTGGGGTKLDGIATVDLATGRLQGVIVSGVLYIYRLAAGTTAESSPTVIRPDDYASSTNEKVWELKSAATLSAAVLDASTGGLGASDSGKLVKFGSDGSLKGTDFFHIVSGAQTGSFNGADLPLTGSWSYYIPNASGLLALAPSVAAWPVTTGFTVSASRYTDQTHYLTSAGTMATGTFTLPAAADSRAGQVIRLWSTQIVTALTVAVSGGGTIRGTALTAAAADTPYAFGCVSTSGSGTWIRIQ